MSDLLNALLRAAVGAFVPSLVMIVVGVLLVGVALGVKRKWRKSFRDPIGTGVLKPPGWGCLERKEDALMNLSMLVMVTSLLWAWLGYVAFQGGNALGIAIVILPFTVFAALRIGKEAKRARTERLGFLGECLVAENLAPLAAEGWRVFHDVPMERDGKGFNIDHVIVGPGGVYAVETKTWSPLRGSRQGDWKVTVEGETAILPSGARKHPLGQAKRQAAALRDFLNGEGVGIGFVHPLVALAGWHVSWKKDANRAICDARNIAGQLKKAAPLLGALEIVRIADMLDRRCRVLRFSEEPTL